VEESLRESEARLNRFVADAPVGLVILGEDKRVICANKALCDLTGYTEQEILGNTYEVYTHPEDLAANLVLTDEFYRGVRSEYALEKRYIRKSGEIIWVAIKSTRVELPGRPGPLLLAAVQDITERKLATEEREQLSRDLHDNILQSLYAVGMQLEAGKMAMGKSPKRSKTHMTHAIDHLNSLMLEVRQYIGLLTQRTVPKPDFGQALRLMVASLSATGQAAPELHIEDPGLSLLSSTQGEQLLNIAREALSNSMRHAQATRRSVQLSSTHRAIRMVIRDDGVGFSLRRRRLCGHGLANMAARAKNIRARLTFRSAPGKGTQVTVEVPRENGTANA
jgi:PAS domain S-box-containing protein